MGINIDKLGAVKLYLTNKNSSYICYGNDALLLNKYARCNLLLPNKVVLVKNENIESIKAILEKFHINYVCLNNRQRLCGKSFSNNKYEVIDVNNYDGVYYFDEHYEPIKKLVPKIDKVFNMLYYLSKMEDPYSHATIKGISYETMMDMILFSESLRGKVEKNKDRTINSKAPSWTKEEDENLLKEYNKNLSIKELSKLHKRKQVSIIKRLKEFGIEIDPKTKERINGSL